MALRIVSPDRNVFKRKSFLSAAVVSREIFFTRLCVFTRDKLHRTRRVFTILFCFLNHQISSSVIYRPPSSANCIVSMHHMFEKVWFVHTLSPLHVYLLIYNNVHWENIVFDFPGFYFRNLSFHLMDLIYWTNHLKLLCYRRVSKDWLVIYQYYRHYTSNALSNNPVSILYFFLHFFGFISIILTGCATSFYSMNHKKYFSGYKNLLSITQYTYTHTQKTRM